MYFHGRAACITRESKNANKIDFIIRLCIFLHRYRVSICGSRVRLRGSRVSSMAPRWPPWLQAFMAGEPRS
jgi:hypothetical protein